ncbi:MAG: YggT family protein [Sideroxyarcus sp.]
MLAETFSFLLDALVQPFAALLLFRFHAVWLRAPMRNPIGEFLMALTDFIVLRARRVIPSASGLDSATLLLAFVVEFIYLLAFLWIQGYPFETFPLVGLLAWTAVKLLKISIYLLVATLIAEALLSWINPRTPLAPMLLAVNRPFLQPLRSRVPLVGNVDLSVLILLIICQLILIVPLGGLEQAVMRLI